MAQIVPVGIDTGGQTGLYSNVSPITSEERAIANNGCGTRITAVRRYRNWFTQLFTGGSVESGFFGTGHLLLISVSNLTLSPGPSDFTHKKLAAGTYDTDINDMFDRIAALPFDTNVTSQSRSITTTNSSTTITGTFTGADVGATISGTNIQASTSIVSQTGTAAVMSKTATGSGAVTATIIQGLTWPYIELIYEHEVDAKGVDGKPGNLYYSNGWKSSNTAAQNGTKDTATDFINAWRHVHDRWVARAAVAGVPTSRVKFNLCYTAFGFAPDRVTQYYPGDAYVDVIGVDPYPAVTATGWLAGAPSGGIKDARSWVIARRKPMSIPEFNFVSTDDTIRPAAFNAMASNIANETQFTYDSVCLFLYPDSTPGYAVNKVAGDSAGGHAYPLTHAAFQGMIGTLGGNPIISTVTQGDPSQPNILSVTSNAAGTQLTMTWDNPAVGDNPTGWNALISLGSVTSGLPKVNTSPLSAATRSYTFSALASGIAISPGTDYSVAVQELNGGTPTGQAVSPAQFVTANQPGPDASSPVITAQSALNDAVDPTTINYTITATSPVSLPLTITHQVTGPAGFAETFTGASASRTYATGGSYTDNVTVADNATPAHTTTTTLQFVIPSGVTVTPNLGLYRPQPGTRFNDPGYGPGILGNFDTIDQIAYTASYIPDSWNAVHGLAASTFDPALCASAPATMVSGWMIWSAVQLQSVSISGIVTLINQFQVGTGTHVGLHDSQGAILVDNLGNSLDFSGTDVDNWMHNGGTGSTSITYTLPTQLVKRTWGELLYISMFFPAGLSTYPTIFGASGLNASMSINRTRPRSGVSTGATGIPSILPTTATLGPLWFGLLP